MSQFGWVPPEQRDDAGQRLTGEFHERIGVFGDVSSELPERWIWAEVEQKQLGRLLPRCFQQTGSCVGAGSFVALQKSFLGDRIARDDNDSLEPHFPWAPYGVSRRIAGMRRPGSGSFGAAMAKAVDDDVFGLLRLDDDRFPQPQVVDQFWLKYTARQELDWSHPSAWPMPESELAQEGKPFGMQDIVRVTNTDQAATLTASGYGITLASMYGSTDMRVRDGILVARRNDRWAHQMSVGGYIKYGDFICIDNQWSKRAHPQCPELAKYGSNGSFWVPRADFDWICSTGEVYAHASGGFEVRRLWGPLW